MNEERLKHIVLDFQPRQLLFHALGDTRLNSQQMSALLDWANKVAQDWAETLPADRKGNITIKSKQALDFGYPADPQSPGVSKSAVKGFSASLPPMGKAKFSLVERLLSLFQKQPRALPPPPFSLVFTNVENDRWPPFSLVFTNVENDRWPLFTPITDSPAQPNQEQRDTVENEAIALKELLKLSRFIHDRRGTAPVQLRGVGLNWLTNGVRSEPGGTGGPGGKPFAAQATDRGKHTFKLPTALSGLMGASSTAKRTDVVVAILDTFYPESELERIKMQWSAHELIPTLLGTPGTPGTPGKLHLHPGYVPVGYMDGVRVDDHEYDMTDHGLFVAGIVHSLAPEAEIHLYQVLNKYGLGDLEGIACAFREVMQDFGNRPLVINSSLTLNLPLKEEHFGRHDDFGMRQAILDERPKPVWLWIVLHWICWALRWLFGRPISGCGESWFDSQSAPFEWMSDLAYVLGSGVIAAAGNNARGSGRPLALYPAAFDSVLGVGALSRGDPWIETNPLLPSRYSNLADTPTTQGITVFGGEEGAGNGLLGVYLGNIPDGTPGGRPNPTGWAWWSGTSFATPIISGLAAALLINGVAPNTQSAIDMLLNTARGTGRTSAFENRLDVEQNR